VASVDNNGITESKIFLVIYKDNPFEVNGLSAYIMMFNVNGTIEKAYDLDDGNQIPFDSNSSLNKSLSDVDCTKFPVGADFEEWIYWVAMCSNMLNPVTIIANNPINNTIDAGQSSGGGCLDCSPLFAFDGSLFNNNNPDPGINLNPNVVLPNLVSADPISISIALEAPQIPEVNTWITNLPTTEQIQDLLQAIAQFLNDNKEKSPDPLFVNTSPNQLPNIKDEAKNTVIDLILLLIENQNSSAYIELVIEILNGANINPSQEKNCEELSELGLNIEKRQSLLDLHWAALNDNFHAEKGYKPDFD
jgi:hypothetical protein